MIRLLLALLILPIAAIAATPIEQISFKTMDGKDASLKDYAGKVILVVNVASRCGNTPQYAALEKLYTQYGPQGFVILGFPCNDFGSQEPGTDEEIKTFCTSKYAVTFPIFDKIHVKGAEQAPLYAALTGPTAKFPGDVKWNFGKFLIGRSGEVLARFEPKVKPDNPSVVSAIEAALKEPTALTPTQN
jgi:glutathione peroxidase